MDIDVYMYMYTDDTCTCTLTIHIHVHMYATRAVHTVEVHVVTLCFIFHEFCISLYNAKISGFIVSDGA